MCAHASVGLRVIEIDRDVDLDIDNGIGINIGINVVIHVCISIRGCMAKRGIKS